MSHDITSTICEITTIGIDLGDRESSFCVLDPSGQVTAEGQVKTRRGALSSFFERERCRVVIEACGHVHWVAELAAAAGHEVVVANPRELRLISKSHRKTDRNDARLLAQLGRADASLLRPIRLHGRRARLSRSLLQSRDQLIRMRTKLINHVRGVVKTFGGRIPSGGTANFHRRAGAHISEDLAELCAPLLEVLATIAEQIKELDRQVAHASERHHPETAVLQQVHGVGPTVALAFAATIEDPNRFASSRRVGAYLGLTPRRSESGARTPELPISKCGDRLLRRLLVNSASYILGPFGKDSDLRRYGQRIARGGSQRDRARARIAVARKLACLLHHLWRTGSVYEPLHAR